jgi:hypothetical protein
MWAHCPLIENRSNLQEPAKGSLDCAQSFPVNPVSLPLVSAYTGYSEFELSLQIDGACSTAGLKHKPAG